jgi:hypothetical protein
MPAGIREPRRCSTHAFLMKAETALEQTMALYRPLCGLCPRDWRGSSKGAGGFAARLLLDHLIRPQQQRRRHGEAEGFGGLEVDYQLEAVINSPYPPR